MSLYGAGQENLENPMRVELKKLLEKLGVNHVLSPYETQPWVVYDSEKGITCSAEVRMGPGGDDIEAEIQFLYDEGVEIPVETKTDTTTGETSTETKTGSTGNGGQTSAGGPVQIMAMRALPTENLWTPKELRVKGENFVNKVHDWEEKCCNFFRACIEALQMNVLPNIEELIEKELDDDDGWGGGKRGRIGRKAPKIKPAQLLGMKKGM
jgi:hypothetical protein